MSAAGAALAHDLVSRPRKPVSHATELAQNDRPKPDSPLKRLNIRNGEWMYTGKHLRNREMDDRSNSERTRVATCLEMRSIPWKFRVVAKMKKLSNGVEVPIVRLKDGREVPLVRKNAGGQVPDNEMKLRPVPATPAELARELGMHLSSFS